VRLGEVRSQLAARLLPVPGGPWGDRRGCPPDFPVPHPPDFPDVTLDLVHRTV